MKIEKLNIYGFGKHENVTVDFGQGITVVYGLNEAGKTTIQQFILHILFGFPPKNNALLRYEPKSGGKYGGQVHLEDETYGKCIVERIRGKSAGDVTVYFEDGTKGGEEQLNTLLRQYDRASFESIFSFSLLQLQGFEKMGEEDLSRTLLASGTTGVDSLLQLGNRMEKELGDLFKKSGRIPEMNVKIMELRELEIELKDEQEKVGEYAPSIERIGEIDNLLIELREQEKELIQGSQKLALVRQLLPLHQKKQVLDARMSQLNAITFPADGIRRYEMLIGKLTEAKATKQLLEEELAEILTRLPEQFEFERIAELEILLSKETEWHRWQTAVSFEEDNMSQLTSSKRRLLDRLGVKGFEAENTILEADVSIQKEEQMHKIIRELTEDDQQIGFVNRQLIQVENELADTETQIGGIERIAPTVEELERVKQWPKIRQQLAEAKAYVSLSGRQAEQKSLMIPALLVVLALAFIVFGFIQTEWLIIIAGVIVLGLGILMYPKKQHQTPVSSKLQQMEKIIAAYDGNERQMEELSERIGMYKRKKEELHEVFMILERKYQTLTTELENVYSNRRQIELELAGFLALYGFNEIPSTGIIPELFRMIREVQEVTRELNDAVIRLQTIQQQIVERLAEAEKVIRKSAPQAMIYEMLRREFIQLNEQAETIKSLTAVFERKESALKETTSLANSLLEKVQALFAESAAETEEAFYAAYNSHQEAFRLKGQLEDVDAQLASHGPLELPGMVMDDELRKKVDDNSATLSSISERQNDLINEKAALVNKTERLLSDENYGRKLQLFEMKKSELAELAKKWSERKAITEAISRTMSELKEKKLPEVLEAAEKLFCELTGGNYESLSVTETGHFEVLAKNGMRYPIVELSQATKEQAYIALRFALAASIESTAPFPLMLDDPFVHFDEERLSRMIELLDNLQNKHQFIYFTCHGAMKDKWREATILNVSEIGSERGAMVL
ncbi:AAA family ATPase [Sporosarcina sp. ANT_H38]|uniref:ATP-binding protein n=1 Tax=Sporosarcina sp. ANT_H38 TaxID=2597358 RepID=UPI0011F2379C|nr:AAA family ATPase [Sporosarcina sp. ANT_H38]KAA0944339.1 AAA family ATPase [Sporosarcina sp. ANT_H38]